MSIVLSVYSKSAFKEFVLPAINNDDTTIIIDKDLFRLRQDVVLKLEVIENCWMFTDSRNSIARGSVPYNREQLRNDDIFLVNTPYEEQISITVSEQESSFCVYEKYLLTDGMAVTIGNRPESMIRYQYQKLVSRDHAVLKMAGGVLRLEDTSRNGVFVNSVRVVGSAQLHFGDSIDIFGLNMVCLGDILAVRPCRELEINQDILKIWTMPVKKIPKPQGVIKRDKEYFHRAPRNIEKLEDEAVEIEAPPNPQDMGETPLAMVIGPAMTMAIPMLLGSGLAIYSSRMSGGNTSAFMYTGLITAISSALIGAGWAIANLRYTKERKRKEELKRFERYSEYLIKCTDTIRGKYEKNTRILNEQYPPAAVCSGYDSKTMQLWNRNMSHGDFLMERLGMGDIPFQVPITIPKEKFTLINDSLADKPKFIQDNYKTLHDVPICMDLLKEHLIGVIGGEHKKGAVDVVYNLVTQIAANNCYTDVKLAFIYDAAQGIDGDCWDFARWLPHVWSEDKKTRYVAGNKSDASDVFYELTKVFRFRSEEQAGQNRESTPKPYYILVIAEPSFLDGEPVARYIYGAENNIGLSTILLAEKYEDLPNAVECIIQNDSSFAGFYNAASDYAKRTAVHFDEMNQKALEALARRLSSIEVNEVEIGGEIPSALTFFDMYGISALNELNVADRWRKNRTYENMKALVGQKAGGAPCYLDVHEKYHGPHGLVAGTTGSGKSETLQTYMLSLAINFSPDDIGFFIIDYKGGGMANLFAGLPHLIGQISNLSGNQVHRAMVSIKSENRRRQRIFNEYGVNNINLYTNLYKNKEAKIPIPHMFIIIDEFAELKREEPDFMRELISVAQVGRSLGVHLILATQKPSGTVDDNIWSNSKFRLCLRVQDRQDSMDMLHKPDAAYLTQAGRCYLQVGNDELYELFQSGFSGASYDAELGNAKNVVAKMISDTGKAGMTGSHTKMKQKEAVLERWLIMLIGYAKEALEQTDRDLERAVDLIFGMMEKDHVDYAKNDYNTRRLIDFTELYEDVCMADPGDLKDQAAQIVLNAKRLGKKLPEQKEKTQLDAVVEYLKESAQRLGYRNDIKLWLPVLPEIMYLKQLPGYEEETFDGSRWPEQGHRWNLQVKIGMYDDPGNQAQRPFTVDFAEGGHHAVCGMVMSGKSTFLQTLAFALVNRYTPDYVNLYAIDFSSRMMSPFEGLAHVGGIMYEGEMEKISKFFTMISRILSERKLLFKGGNYSQYVQANGVTCPSIIVMIDSYANFKEKTENQYEDVLIQLAKEGSANGIYLVLSAAGYSSAEIQSKIGDNIRTSICLEMADKFQYADALKTMRVSILPEANKRGRGLAVVDGSILEFQTALSAEAEDDYKRMEAIKAACGRMNRCWQGKRAKPIPEIPVKPVWSEFAALEDTVNAAKDDRTLPVGYNMETAAVYGIDLSKIYCFLVSGKARTGKTNLMKVMIRSAALRGEKIWVIESGAEELRQTAEEAGAEYLDSDQKVYHFFESIIPSFKARNQLKRQCVSEEMEEDAIYERMQEHEKYHIFIADLVSFVNNIYNPQPGVASMHGFVENITDKGALHNVFFYACFNQDNIKEVAGRRIYENFIRMKNGIHLGGKADEQRIFDFNSLPFMERSKAMKVGNGMIPSEEGEKPCRVVIPLSRG